MCCAKPAPLQHGTTCGGFTALQRVSSGDTMISKRSKKLKALAPESTGIYFMHCHRNLSPESTGIQQQPLKPGSAKKRLADALKVEERKV